MFVPCFHFVFSLEFCFNLSAIDRAPKNWSSTYGQELLAFGVPNFGAKVWNDERKILLALPSLWLSS
jgi:hypothetical protein